MDEFRKSIEDKLGSLAVRIEDLHERFDGLPCIDHTERLASMEGYLEGKRNGRNSGVRALGNCETGKRNSVTITLPMKAMIALGIGLGIGLLATFSSAIMNIIEKVAKIP